MNAEDDDCLVCGKAHPRCQAHRRHASPPEPCMRWPRRLERACDLHGGATKAARAKGERARRREALQADINAALATTGHEGLGDPLEALERIATMQLNAALSAGERVNALDDLRYISLQDTEQLRSEVLLFQGFMRDAMKSMELVAKYRPDGEAAAARNLLTSVSEKIAALDISG